MMQRRTFVAGAIGLSSARTFAAVAPKETVRSFAMKRRFAATPFGRIAYLDEGMGPAALFLHGFPLNSFQWRDVIANVCTVRRCLAPDFLGLGYSEPNHGQSLEPSCQVEMLAAFLDGFGIDQVDIVANDSGGAVAQLFVIAHPGRVRSLLLTNCDVEPDCPPPALQPVLALAKEGRFTRQWLEPWLHDKDLARSAQGLGGMCYSVAGHPSDEAIDCYLTPLVANPARTDGYAMALEKNALAGSTEKLRGWKGPVRIVWGAADTIFAPENPHFLDKVFAGSRGIRTLPTARLFFPEEYPGIIAQEALALWKA